jgi:hypothetical protein
MAGKIMTPEEAADLKRLLEEHAAATHRAREILRAYGMDSKEYTEAELVASDLWKRIRKLQGEDGPWLS